MSACILTKDHHLRTNTERRPETSENATLLEDARRKSRRLGHVDLHKAKGNEKGNAQGKTGNDATTVPGVLEAAPLQGEQEADDAGDQQQGADGVELGELLAEGQLGGLAVGQVEQKGNDHQGHAAEGQVDVEAPAPGDVGGEGAADEGPDDGGEAKDGAEQALVEGPLVQGHGVDDDDDDAGEDAGGAHAGNGAAHDEDGRARGGAADGGADLEQQDGGHEGQLHREEGVDLAKHQLEGGRREQVGRAVPAHVGQGVEFISDARNGL